MYTPTLIAHLEKIFTHEKHRFGLFHPLAILEHSESLPKLLTSSERTDLFPNRGLVSWVDPPTNTPQGTVWEFRIAEQAFHPDNKNHDQFRVAQHPNAAIEVIDLQKLGSPEEARIFFESDGLNLPYIPSERAILWVAPDCFVGPLHLCPSDNGSYKIEVIRNGQPVSPFPIHSGVASYQFSAKLDGSNRAFIFTSCLGGPNRFTDWSPDEVVLKRVFKMVRQLAEVPIASVTDKTLNVLSKDIPQFSAALDSERISRARKLLQETDKVAKLVPSFSAELLQLPVVTSEIEQEKARIEGEVRKRVENALSSELTRHNQLTEQCARLSKQSEQLEKEIEIKRTQYSSELSEIESHYKSRIQELLSSPGELLADTALISRLLSVNANQDIEQRLSPEVSTSESKQTAEDDTTQQKDRTTDNFEASLIFPPGWPTVLSENGIVDLKQLKSILTATRGSVRAETIRRIVCSLAAGLVPLISGKKNLESIIAVANAVANGRVISVPISPSYTDPVHVFGSIVNNKLVRSPGCLVDVLRIASRSDDLYVVVLDGINRCAPESFFLPIARSYVSSQNSRPVALPLLPASFSQSVGGLEGLNWLIWPRNVLLTATLVIGPSVLPLNGDVLSLSTVIFADPERSKRDTETAHSRGSLTFEKFKSLLSGAGSEAALEKTLSDDLANVVDVNDCRVLFNSTSAMQPDSKTAFRDVYETYMLPGIISGEASVTIAKQVQQKAEIDEGDIALLQQRLKSIVSWR